jgi:hypothetical protein
MLKYNTRRRICCNFKFWRKKIDLVSSQFQNSPWTTFIYDNGKRDGQFCTNQSAIWRTAHNIVRSTLRTCVRINVALLISIQRAAMCTSARGSMLSTPSSVLDMCIDWGGNCTQTPSLFVLFASWEFTGNVHFESLTTKAIYGRISDRSCADTESDCIGGVTTNIVAIFCPSKVTRNFGTLVGCIRCTLRYEFVNLLIFFFILLFSLAIRIFNPMS